jgi:hypothetical protein
MHMAVIMQGFGRLRLHRGHLSDLWWLFKVTGTFAAHHMLSPPQIPSRIETCAIGRVQLTNVQLFSMTYILLGHVLMPLGMPNIDKKEHPFRGKLYVDFCNTVILRSWLGSSSPK